MLVLGVPTSGPGFGPTARDRRRYASTKYGLTNVDARKAAKSEAHSCDPIGLFWRRAIEFESNRELARSLPGPERKTCELTS